jgi:predicted DNA-binding protein
MLTAGLAESFVDHSHTERRLPRALTAYFGRSSKMSQHRCVTLKSMPSVTSSFRMSKELQQELSNAAERTGKGKNAIIIEALKKYLHAMERESLARECQSRNKTTAILPPLTTIHRRGCGTHSTPDSKFVMANSHL